MKKLTLWQRVGRRISLAALGLSLWAAPHAARAADYYVDTKGSDANPGTLAMPFASMQKGADVAVAGDTVYIRGGTYKVVDGDSDSAGVTLSKSGQSDTKRINFFAYQSEHPIFDFSGLRLSKTATCAGVKVTGSWLHLKGLEIFGVPMPGTVSNNGIWANGGSNNTYELLDLHHNDGPGLSIANGNGGNLILNCDSHDNYDPNAAQGAGQNADGFGCHYQKTGPSTVYRGCRAWWNSDDGYDLISQEVSVRFENSWAMGNGYINSGKDRPAQGNGNGFKAGSSKTGVRHVIQNCLAWKNGAAGFYANHSSGGNTWYNNTAYNNSVQYNMLASPAGDSGTTIILMGSLVHKMRNNIGFPNKNTNMGGADTAFNTWDLDIVPAADDFASLSDEGFMGPRQADGSLPALNFMKLKAGSQMIDKGTDVGLPAVGAKPDLGAYEFGASGDVAVGGGANGGSGGSGAMAGSSAVGGSAPDLGGAPGSAGRDASSVSGTPGEGLAGGGAIGGMVGGGGTDSGVAPSVGGAVDGNAGAAQAGQSTDGEAANGCSCRIAGAGVAAPWGTNVFGLAALALLSSRRSRRGRRAPARAQERA